MERSFVGLTVFLQLQSGLSLTGRVSEVNPHTRLLTLVNVVIHVDGGQRLSKYSVAGSQIVDLKIMPQDAAARQINGQASWSGPTNGNGTTAAGDSITDPAIISMSGNLANEPPPPPAATSQQPTLSEYTLSRPPLQQAQLHPPPPVTVPPPVLHGDNHENPYLKFQQQPLLLLEEQAGWEDGRFSHPPPPPPPPPPPHSHQHQPHASQHTLQYDFAELTATPGAVTTSSNAGVGNIAGSYVTAAVSPCRSPTLAQNGPTPEGGGTGQVTPKRGGKKQQQHWVNENVKNFQSKEFDFQGNLDLFDKQRVFAELRKQTSQKVVTQSATATKFSTSAEEDTRDEGDAGEEDDDEEEEEESVPRVIFHTINNRIPIQAITVTQLMELLRVGMLETGPSAEQMAENGGRAAATLCLQRLNLKNLQKLPTVMVLVGRHWTGEYALATARHLLNRGCKVMAWTEEAKDDRFLSKSMGWQQKVFVEAGGKFIQSIAGIERVDLVIDGLLSYHYKSVNDISDGVVCKKVRKLISWADKQPFTISLEVPSAGIRPNILICFGAPTVELSSYNSGELYLADIGLPKPLWNRVVGSRNILQKSRDLREEKTRKLWWWLRPVQVWGVDQAIVQLLS